MSKVQATEKDLYEVKVSEANGNYELDPGTHQAVIADITRPFDSEYKGKKERKVIIVYELTGESYEKDNEKHNITKFMYVNLKINPKSTLYSIIKAVAGGKDFDVNAFKKGPVDLKHILIGKNVLISLESKPKVTADGQNTTTLVIKGVSPLVKGMVKSPVSENYVRPDIIEDLIEQAEENTRPRTDAAVGSVEDAKAVISSMEDKHTGGTEEATVENIDDDLAFLKNNT